MCYSQQKKIKKIKKPNYAGELTNPTGYDFIQPAPQTLAPEDDKRCWSMDHYRLNC